jgi:hypothetical protein
MNSDHFKHKVVIKTSIDVRINHSDEELNRVINLKQEMVKWLIDQQWIPGIHWQYAERKFAVSEDGFVIHIYEFHDPRAATLFKLKWSHI